MQVMDWIWKVWYLIRRLGLHRNVTHKHPWEDLLVEALASSGPFPSSFLFSLSELLYLFVLQGPTYMSLFKSVSLYSPTSLTPEKNNQLLFVAIEFCLCLNIALHIVPSNHTSTCLNIVPSNHTSFHKPWC